jgi:TetR/AcrR family transcriptional regulator, tetracycline repressor protein
MPLERESMIRVALTLLNEVGLDGLTVRRLAEHLGVQNPALYWHFKNKQELLDEMARTMLADAFAGIELPLMNDRWAEWLEGVAERFRLALLTYHDGARVIATADLTESALLAIQEMALRVLTAAGFDLRTALVSVVAIFDYTLGATFEEQADPDYFTTNRSSVLRSHLLSRDPARFPHLAAALDEITATATHDPQVGFKGGLRLLLAGMVTTKQTTGS